MSYREDVLADIRFTRAPIAHGALTSIECLIEELGIDYKEYVERISVLQEKLEEIIAEIKVEFDEIEYPD